MYKSWQEQLAVDVWIGQQDAALSVGYGLRLAEAATGDRPVAISGL